MSKYVDTLQLRKALNILKPNGQLFEIRILHGRNRSTSGYFKSIDDAVEALDSLPENELRNTNVYFTLNSIKEDCYSRIQRNRICVPEDTTGDTDIANYEWLFIDLDPIRAKGTSSSNEQLEKAKEMAVKVSGFLKREGFEDPVIGMSGNGIHLLYKVALAVDKSETVKQFLEALDLMFSDNIIKVDTVTHNPSRICKMYGTLAQKGAGTDERPHRMSYIVKAPEQIKTTRLAYIEKIVGMLPQKEKPQAYNNYSPQQFDVVEWMNKHGISYQEKAGSDYTKFVLDACPFDHNHKAPDSMITIGRSGAIGFRCLHNSCRDKTWRDVRLLFEPEAYDKNADDERINAGWSAHVHNRDHDVPYTVPEEETPDQPYFFTAEDVINMPEEDDVFIRSGIEGIDNRLGGLKKGYVSLLSGNRGGSKSTLLTTIALTAINDGNNVLCYSGELTARDFMAWMNLQAAGKDHVKQSSKYPNHYYVTQEDRKKIALWLGEHFLLWNNDHGNDFSKLYSHITQQVEKQKTDLIILDNLMTVDLRSLDRNNKYNAQAEFIECLMRLAKQTRTHIIFVAHPRKTDTLIRLEDIAGTGNLANRIDNAFFIHRNNDDFKKRSKETKKWRDDHEAYQGTNVIEIAKDRHNGIVDVWVPLWYEPETKRLKNSPAEMVRYGCFPDDDWIAPDEIPF